jgi:hypothetical protein
MALSFDETAHPRRASADCAIIIAYTFMIPALPSLISNRLCKITTKVKELTPLAFDALKALLHQNLNNEKYFFPPAKKTSFPSKKKRVIGE